MEFFAIFKEKWEKDLPSAVKCLENSIQSCLTFFICPEEEWISACYTLLAFICLKMELHWRSNPIGKVRNNLPFLKELAFEKLTQKS
jgi:putative transposase